MIVTGLAVAAAAWGVLMGVSPVLQIRRMVRQRSSRDVSIGYFVILLVGFLLWLGYGVAARNLALIVPNAVALLIGASTIAVALRLGQRTAGPARHGRWDKGHVRSLARTLEMLPESTADLVASAGQSPMNRRAGRRCDAVSARRRCAPPGARHGPGWSVPAGPPRSATPAGR